MAKDLHNSELPETATCRRFWGMSLALYIAFVIYGSLVPFDFQFMPVDEAWDKFLNIRYLPLQSISRTDWAANFLLGIPLAFLSMGTLNCSNKSRFSFFSLPIVIIFCISISSMVEFMQFFFPSRVTSLNDIAAQSIGASFGTLAWLCYGRSLTGYLLGFRKTDLLSNKIDILFWAYLAIFLAYNIMPLDIAVSPSDIYQKWKAGRINMVPFAFPVRSFTQGLYGFIIDVLVWVPIAIFFRSFKRFNPILSVVCVVLAAAIIEFLQIFIYSRVVDTTDIFSALLGGCIGAWVGHVFTRKNPPQPSVQIFGEQQKNKLLISLACLLAWVTVLVIVFWYPFKVNSDILFLKERLHAFSLLPFKLYQTESVYGATTQLFRKFLFFFPLGAIIFFFVKSLGKSVKSHSSVFFAFVLCFVVACMIETGQFFLPGKVPDITDMILETLGGILGFFLLCHLNFSYKPPSA